MLEINDNVRAVMVKVLYDSITAEQREKLLQDALASLITPPPQENWHRGKQPSPLEKIFTDCAYDIARQIISEQMKKDDKVKSDIEKLYAEALAKVFVTDREQTVSKMASALTQALAELRDR
jgi:hypothetical protein